MTLAEVRFGLFHKLVCFGTCLVITTGILASVLFHSYASKMVRTELSIRGKVLASNLARNSRRGVETGNVFRTLNPLVLSVAMEKDVALVRVLDARGEVLAEAGNNAANQNILEVASPIFSNAEILSMPNSSASEAKPHIIGNVQLHLSLAAFRDQIRQATVFALILMGVVMTLGLAAAYAFSRHLTRPIEAMAQAADRIGRGDYGIVVPVFAGDELGTLASAFNEMSRNLHETSGCLEEIVENMLDIIIVVRADGTIRRVNRVVSGLLGYAPGELSGKHVDLLFAGAGANPFRGNPMEQLLKEGAIRDVNVHLASNEGRAVAALFSAFLVKDEDGRPYAIVGTARAREEDRCQN